MLTKPLVIAAFVIAVASWPLAAGAEVPEAIAAKGESVALQVHAEGAQVYECKADAGGKLAWQFREPIASLFKDGKTVGRHYAGPNWEIEGGGRCESRRACTRSGQQGHSMAEAGGYRASRSRSVE
jgi:hypothetical protein